MMRPTMPRTAMMVETVVVIMSILNIAPYVAAIMKSLALQEFPILLLETVIATMNPIILPAIMMAVIAVDHVLSRNTAQIVHAMVLLEEKIH